MARTPVPSPAVIILAAGASVRLGQPKALCELPGGLPVLRLLRAAREAFPASASCAPHVIIVTGAHHDPIAAALEQAGEDTRPLAEGGLLLRNSSWELGRTSSIQLSAKACPGRDVLIAPVDHPRINAQLLGLLLEAWKEHGSPARGWLAPYVHSVDSLQSDQISPHIQAEPAPSAPGQKHFGHPVILGRGLLDELHQLPPNSALRQLRQVAEPLVGVEVTSTAILENLDTPADLLAIYGADSAPESPSGAMEP
jgi:CTP:molybdopterin cytidylyltransferase MocA